MTCAFPTDDTIRHKSIEKLYYQAYAHRVLLSYKPKQVGRLAADFKKTMMLKAVEHACRSSQDWNYRKQLATVAFYFVNGEDAAAFANQMLNHVQEINYPPDGFPLERVSNDRTLVYRSMLWFCRFRYKIAFRSLSIAETEALSTWVKETFDDLPHEERLEKVLISLGKSQILYLSEEDDVLLLKMIFPEYNPEVAQVILHNE